jgi:hypothetical protein
MVTFYLAIVKFIFALHLQLSKGNQKKIIWNRLEPINKCFSCDAMFDIIELMRFKLILSIAYT